jgi:hypothetical protein
MEITENMIDGHSDLLMALELTLCFDIQVSDGNCTIWFEVRA